MPTSNQREVLQENVELLLVDDRRDNLLAMESVLANSGCNLIKVESGDEALRYLLDHEPALILMDVQMPNLDGFETAALIKRSERTREIPIIFITAISKDERFVQKGYAHGAVDYLYKPYDPQILRSKVAVFVELARKTKRLLNAERTLRENEKHERERQLALLELRGLRREQADQKKYRDLVDGINHGIVWSANADSLVVSFVSPSAERILGYPLAQWSEDEQFLKRRLHDDDRERFLDAIKKARESDEDIGLEHRFLTSDQKEVWMHTGFRVVRTLEGSGHEVRGLSIDISLIKEAETVLHRSKKRSDFMAHASMMLSESLDYDATLDRIGKLVVPALGDWYSIDMLDDAEHIKTVCVRHVDAKKQEFGLELFGRYPLKFDAASGVAKVLRSGVSELHADIPGESIIDEAHDVGGLEILQALELNSVMIAPLQIRGKTMGTITLAAGESTCRYTADDLDMLEDLARRFASAIDNAVLYRAAQDAIRTRDEFLSIASHELKTPLTPLKLQTQVLMRTLKATSLAQVNQDRVERMLETSDRQLTRLSRLIDALLDISRINSGKLTLDLEKFDLTELVHEVIERFSGQLSAVKCEVDFDLGTKPVWVNWDRFRIEQVVINLLTNAMKYAPGKPIHITIERGDDRVVFSVSDEGIGIAAKDQKRIFDRFERAVSGDHVGGLGLGLYIVAQILEAHGGSIAVTSELGKGSTFTVSMPREAPKDLYLIHGGRKEDSMGAASAI